MINTSLLGKDDGEQVEELSLGELLPFENHPFQVGEDRNFGELLESIGRQGVLTPILVRPKGRGTFEIISGHRRKKACEMLGLETIPAFIRDLPNEEATLHMVDANIQRESLLFSEKAFAYKMKLEALKEQIKRNSSEKKAVPVGHEAENTQLEIGVPVGHREENTQLEIGVPVGHMGNNTQLEIGVPVGHMGNHTQLEMGVPVGHMGNHTQLEIGVPVGHRAENTQLEIGVPLGHRRKTSKRTRELLAENTPDSSVQIQRYLRLTYLHPELLAMVDVKKIPFQTGVELSYLKEGEQAFLLAVMKEKKQIPTLIQATELKQESQIGNLSEEKILAIFQKEKKRRLQLQADMNQFFSEETSSAEMEAVILSLLERWKREGHSPFFQMDESLLR